MDILKIVRTSTEFDEMCNVLAGADFDEIGLDTETSSLKWYDGHVIGYCLACSVDKQYFGYYVPVRHVEDPDQELDPEWVEQTLNQRFISNPGYKKVLFNKKFDNNFMQNHINVIDLGNDDAMILMFLRNENEPSHRLKRLSDKYLGEESSNEEKEVAVYFKRLPAGSHYGHIPVRILGPYGAKDPILTLKLKRFGGHYIAKEESSQKDGLTKEIYEHELAFTNIVTKMERQGVPYSVPVADEIFATVRPAADSLAEHIYNLSGRRFNIGSSKELDVILREVFKFPPVKLSPRTKEPMWGKGELMQTKSEIGQCIAAWRNLDHSLSSFDEGIKQYVRDGKIYCSYNQIGAKTGRASASEPNLQQMPKRLPKYNSEWVPDYAITAIAKAFQLRKAFRAPDGWKIVSIDESQFELRLLCHYSQDKRMLQAFAEGRDIHTFTASLIFKVDYDTVSWWQRDVAKEINFAIVYGAGILRVLQTLLERGVDTSYDDVRRMRLEHSREFSDISSFVTNVQSTIRRRGYIFNYYGRHKRIPADKAYVGVNHLIQGVTADMLKDAAIRCDEVFKNVKCRTWLGMMIHDESLFIMPDNELHIIDLLRFQMEHFPWVRCPIVAEVSIGQSWGELEDWNG